jgi:hypothetical protein
MRKRGLVGGSPRATGYSTGNILHLPGSTARGAKAQVQPPSDPPLDELTRVLRGYLSEMGPDLALIVGPDVFADVVGQYHEAALYRNDPPKNAKHRWLALLAIQKGLINFSEDLWALNLETIEALEKLVRKAFIPALVQELAVRGRKNQEACERGGREAAKDRKERDDRSWWLGTWARRRRQAAESSERPSYSACAREIRKKVAEGARAGDRVPTVASIVRWLKRHDGSPG